VKTALLLAAGLCAATQCLAREEPLWEAGIGAAAIDFPHYRGSTQSSAYVFPFPYFVYRGELLKADRRGVRGLFVKTENVNVDLSLGASPPVSSGDDRAREGMPDLRGSVEVGPTIALTAWHSVDRRVKLDLRVSARAAATIESRSRFIGGELFPHVNLDVRGPLGYAGWRLGLLAGPMYADHRNNAYFYSVAPQFATASRPAYEARGGFAGTQFVAALSKRFPKFWIGAFARYDSLRGAVFEESPLVGSKRYVAGGLGVSWILGTSKERVHANEEDE
jgi:outer membrane scaffolding protein for murein synthesis (MipA/OmpV family)